MNHFTSENALFLLTQQSLFPHEHLVGQLLIQHWIENA